MGLRESMAKHTGRTAAVVAGVIVVCVGWCAYVLSSGQPGVPTKAYYTVDDGTTWFVDSNRLVPPFDHDGKQAVRVQMFTCAERKTPFVGYLVRYTPEMKRKLDASAATAAPGKPATFTMDSQGASGGMELKKPGDVKWISGSDYVARAKLFRSLCPSGDVDQVLP